MIYNRACNSYAFKIFFSCSLSAPLFKAESRAEKDIRPLSHLVLCLPETNPLVVLSRPLQTGSLLYGVRESQLVIGLKAPWRSLLRRRSPKGRLN